MAKQKSRKVQQARNTQFVGILIVIAVIGVAAIGYVVTRPGATALTVDPTIPAGTAEGYLLGRADAPVQVIEFGDFECPGCGDFSNVTEPDVRQRLVQTGIVAFRFMDFPLPMHRNTWTAHLAAGCAGVQGKFWEMHDMLFSNQNDWNGIATTSPLKVIKRYATALGLNVDAWETCVTTQSVAGRIKANSAEGVRRQVGGTPTFIIGNKMLPSGPIGYDGFKAYVDSAMLALPKAPAAPSSKTAPATPAKKSAGAAP